MTIQAAWQALTGHRHYRYRGCAPDPDQPSRAAVDPALSLDAWLPYTGDGAEPQRDRIARERAAIDACIGCPVMVQCLTYATTEIVDTDPVSGKVSVRLAEPEGIWGGMLALERHRALIARRAGHQPPRQVPDEVRTPQKLAVLAALAVELYDEHVAARAGMDVRTANWHRSQLCTHLGLDKDTASRDDLLAAALRFDLIPAGVRVVWDGLWPMPAAPTTDGIRHRRLAPGVPPALLTDPPVTFQERRKARALRRSPRPGWQTRPTARRPAARARHLTVVPARTADHLPAAPVLEPAA